MGKYAQSRRRGGGGTAAPALPVPTISDLGGQQLQAAVVGAAPVNARWYHSDDPGGPFALVATQPWGDSMDASVLQTLWQVEGVNAGAVLVTARSETYNAG